MTIKVTWTKASGPATFVSYNLYRAETSAAVYSSPVIFTTSDVNILEYRDSDAALVSGKTYYYGVEIKTADAAYRSDIFPVVPTPYPGEGGTDIVSGDSQFGFIGTMDKGLYYVALGAVRALMIEKGVTNIGSTDPGLVAGGEIVLNKFVYNGQIIYVPTAYQDYSTASYRPQLFYDTILKDMIDSPRTIVYNGNNYRIVLLTKDQVLDLHFSSTTLQTGKPHRFVKTQSVSTVTRSNVSGCWFAPNEVTECWAYTSQAASALTFSDLAYASGRTGVPIAWGLVPVPVV